MLPPIHESLRFFVATLPDSYYDFPPRIRNLHSSRRFGGGGGGDREAVSADGGLPAEKFGVNRIPISAAHAARAIWASF